MFSEALSTVIMFEPFHNTWRLLLFSQLLSILGSFPQHLSILENYTPWSLFMESLTQDYKQYLIKDTQYPECKHAFNAVLCSISLTFSF